MKKSILTSVLAFMGFAVLAQTPNFISGQQYAPEGGQAVLQLIKTDAQNNVYIYGIVNDTVDVDLGSGTTLVGLNGNYETQDYFQKQDANGNVVWTIVGLTLADPYEQYITDFSVDASGNIYLVGSNNGNIVPSFDADPGVGTSTINALGSNWDVFLIKLSNAGSHVWSTIFGTSTAHDDIGSVETDSQGNVLVAFEAVNPSSSSYTSGTILKISPAGALLFQKSLQGPGKCSISDILVDGSNNIIVGGYYMHDIDFDPGSGTVSLTSNYSKRNKFILKLNSSGVYQWVNDVKCEATGSSYRVYGLSCDALGNIYQTGVQAAFTVNYGPNATYPLTHSGSGMVPFVHKVSASGSHQWAKLAAVTPYQDYYSVGINTMASNDVILVSNFLNYQSNVSIFSETDGTELFNDTIFSMGMISGLTSHEYTKSNSAIANDGSFYLLGTSNQAIHPDFADNNFIFNNLNGSVNAFLLKYQTCSLDNSVSISGVTLTATQANASYQWIDCNNGNAPINGATSQSFTPNANGNYAVIVDNGSCSVTSTCTVISTVGLEELVPNTSIYPNPATEQIIVQTPNGEQLFIYNQLGELVKEIQLNSGETMVELTELANGIYTIQISHQNGMKSAHKLIKQ